MRAPGLSSRLALRNRTCLPFWVHQQAPLATASLIRCLGRPEASARASTASRELSTVRSMVWRMAGLSTPVSGKQARHYSGNGYGSAPVPAVLLFVKADIQGDRMMPLIGWLFLFAAFALVVGSLLFLRDSANMKIPKEKLEKIRERKAEQEKKDEEWYG